MPYKEKTVTRLYWSISEVAEMLDVNTSLIRFWEKEFPMLRPAKNKKGNRQFSQVDVDLLKRIHHLVKEKGYTLPGAREALKQKPAEQEISKTPEFANHDRDSVLRSLQALRTRLLQLVDDL
jgi:DNA-binding transcriptional MerR regulator